MRYEQNQSSKRLDNRSRFLPARIRPKADEPKSFDFLPSACSKSSFLPSVTLLSQRHTRREQSIAQRHTRLQAPNSTCKAIFCEKGNPSTPNQKTAPAVNEPLPAARWGAPPLLRPNAARTGARDLCVPPAEPCAPLGAGQRVSSAPFGSLRLAVVSPFCTPRSVRRRSRPRRTRRPACALCRFAFLRWLQGASRPACASFGAFGALWSVPPSRPEGLSGGRSRAKNACACWRSSSKGRASGLRPKTACGGVWA